MVQDQQSQLEIYIENFNPDPKNFEMIPNILDHLTYIEEIEDKQSGLISYQRSRIKPLHKEIYRIIKRIAGEEVCMRTEEYVANYAGCSQEAVSEAKKVLSGSFEQLDGMGLIEISEKRISHKVTEDGEIRNVNKKQVHIIRLNNIWRFNNSHMKTLGDKSPPPMKQPLTKKEAELAIEKMAQGSIASHVHNYEAEPKNRVSPIAEPKNRVSPKEGRPEKSGRHKTYNKTPLFKEQNPTANANATAVQMSLINQKDVGDNFKSQHLANDFLRKLGIGQKIITRLFGSYQLCEMEASIYYLQSQFKKKPCSSTIPGYFIKTLENRWWMSRAD